MHDILLAASWALSLLMMLAVGGMAGFVAAMAQIRGTMRTTGEVVRETVREAAATLKGKPNE